MRYTACRVIEMIKANKTACPGEARLESYLTGRSDEMESELIETHLSECVSCEKSLADLERGVDSIVGRLRAANQDSHAQDVASDLELQKALRASQELLVEAKANSSSIGSSPAWAPPQNEIGPYELIRSIGGGGMGSVFLAEHRELGKQVALKLLPGHSSGNAHRVDRFLKEIRAAGSLEHPAIVNATDAGQDNGVHYLAMEYVEGLDLSRVARSATIPVADACEAIRQVAIGLAHAHCCGVVHRDVKPSNIMIRDDGEVKILDFGLAQISQWDSNYAELTTVGQLMGTLDYMSPEQADQPASVDYRADLYSLGATLFRLIGGRPPLAASPGLSPLAKLRLLANHRPPRIDTLRAELPVELVELTDQLLATVPDDRPASASHVAEALRPFCQQADLSALVASAKSSIGTEDHSVSFTFGSAKAAPANELPLRNNRWAAILGWLAVPILLIAGYMITIETSKGHLVIESEVDGVSIELSSDSGNAEELRITQGVNSTRLKAGKYDVVLDAKSDGIQVDKQTITVLRGKTTIARIRRTTSTQTHAKPNSRGAMSTSQVLDSIRRSRATSVNPQRQAIPASDQPLEPGQQIRLVSAADKDLEMVLTVLSDYTIKPRLLGVVSVKNESLVRAETKLNALYREFYESPDVELFLEIEEQPGNVAIDGPLPGVTSLGVTGPGVTRSDRVSGGSLGMLNAFNLRQKKQAVYQGQTLRQWLDIVETERSTKRILEAIGAIKNLAETKDQQVVVTVFRENHDRIPSSNILALLLKVVPPSQQAAFFVQQLEQGEPSWRAAILKARYPTTGLGSDVLSAIADWTLDKGLVPQADKVTIDAAFHFAQQYVLHYDQDASTRDRVKDRLREISIGSDAIVSPFEWFSIYRNRAADQWVSRLVFDVSRALVIEENTPDLELSAALATISRQIEADLQLISSIQDDEALIKAIGRRLASTDRQQWTNRIESIDPDFSDYYRRNVIDPRAHAMRTGSFLVYVQFRNIENCVHSDPIVEMMKLVGQLSLAERFAAEITRIHEQTLASAKMIKRFLETPAIFSVEIDFPTMTVQEVHWENTPLGAAGNIEGEVPGSREWFDVYIHGISSEMLKKTDASPVELDTSSRN